MTIRANWGKVVPTATVVIVGGWTATAHGGAPWYLPDLLNDPVTTVPVPPAVVPPPFSPPPPVVVPPPPYVVPPPIVVPPTVVPPTVVPPTVVPPAEVPPTPEPPPVCNCSPPTPQQTPEPATLISGLIGLAVAGGAGKARRRFWPTKD